MPERDKLGKFIKGNRYSKNTEFKRGEHWRKHKEYWDYEWLYNEYIVNKRSAKDIAKQFNVVTQNIIYHLNKNKIPRRTISETRKLIDYSFMTGKNNPMYGRCNELNGNWKGGCSSERGIVYSSLEWADCVKYVWDRDKATCQRCNKYKGTNDEFHIHHIVSFKDKTKRFDKTNLILLCKKCHNFIHSNKNINKELIIE